MDHYLHVSMFWYLWFLFFFYTEIFLWYFLSTRCVIKFNIFINILIKKFSNKSQSLLHILHLFFYYIKNVKRFCALKVCAFYSFVHDRIFRNWTFNYRNEIMNIIWNKLKFLFKKLSSTFSIYILNFLPNNLTFFFLN